MHNCTFVIIVAYVISIMTHTQRNIELINFYALSVYAKINKRNKMSKYEYKISI